MKVRCERDGTTFDAIEQPYPMTTPRQSTFYDRNGDRFIECPTCARRYFYYDNGDDAVELYPDGKTGWHSDRPLTIISV